MRALRLGVLARAESRALLHRRMAAVKGAWESALQAGGTDDGEPSKRAELGTSYYSAYLLDPDGYRLEVAVET